MSCAYQQRKYNKAASVKFIFRSSFHLLRPILSLPAFFMPNLVPSPKRQKGVVSFRLSPFPGANSKTNLWRKSTNQGSPRPTASHVWSRSSAHLPSSHGAAFPKEQGVSLNPGSVRRSRRNSIVTTPACPGQRERGGRGDKSKTPQVGHDKKAEEKDGYSRGGTLRIGDWREMLSLHPVVLRAAQQLHLILNAGASTPNLTPTSWTLFQVPAFFLIQIPDRLN